MAYNKILIAIDSSPRSLSTAKAGFEIARLLHAHIGLVYVIDRAREMVSADLGLTPEMSQTVLLKQAQETMAQIIELNAGNEQVYRFTPEGFPEKEILDTAKEWEADMIVVGARSQTPVDRFIRGNLVSRIIKHSPKPVVVVN
ncbi:MAG TPA: universal stress protein [Puia sp.]|nr:universal stress protein [Puia sp.]